MYDLVKDVLYYLKYSCLFNLEIYCKTIVAHSIMVLSYSLLGLQNLSFNSGIKLILMEEGLSRLINGPV